MKRFLQYVIAISVVIGMNMMATEAQTIERQSPKTTTEKKKSSQNTHKSTSSKAESQKSLSKKSGNTSKKPTKDEKTKPNASSASSRKNTDKKSSHPAEVTVAKPRVNKSYDKTTVIDCVMLKNDHTAIMITCRNDMQGGGMNISPKAYIIANGKKYTLVKAKGIEISPEYTYFDYIGQSKSFTLYFPPIPLSTTSIDFIESENSEWRFYGIQLQRSSSSKSNYQSSKQQESSYPVTFSCNVHNADLYVDGKLMGSANGNYNLSPNTHSVVVKSPGYADNTAVIDVTSAASYHYDLVQAIDVTRISENMVLVRGGSYKMGATREQGKGTGKNEKPTHTVTVSDFYICKFEVTQELWQTVMGTNPSYFKGEAHRPVECVSWEDCQEFLRKLNALTGKRYRLPTEAEWEYAARGGSMANGNKYSGGKELGDVAWYDLNSNSMTHPVGTKFPNELGLYDMSGNVAEWCQDWYSAYGKESVTNPRGPHSGSGRVFRGGSWSDNATYCRVANRLDNAPSYMYYGIGLRLAASSLYTIK